MRHNWTALRPHLAADGTLVVPDRRGRGGGGDDLATRTTEQVETGDWKAAMKRIYGEEPGFQIRGGCSFGS